MASQNSSKVIGTIPFQGASASTGQSSLNAKILPFRAKATFPADWTDFEHYLYEKQIDAGRSQQEAFEYVDADVQDKREAARLEPGSDILLFLATRCFSRLQKK